MPDLPTVCQPSIHHNALDRGNPSGSDDWFWYSTTGPYYSPQSDEVSQNKQQSSRQSRVPRKVLYKNKCDKHLNKIIKRISADEHEVEIPAKKYEDKYKQVGGVSSSKGEEVRKKHVRKEMERELETIDAKEGK
ncbi:hypothetical protein TanjilG_17543 [Lupinus angustifolius]|uniref:Uncharacterized protein n=1 Tax=Lupinus angustifolius TaxID=3871 RepID=A0A1J7IK88_LUPAN|nr:hypothetical protein TanjilG_17543 [Lupinus angustifolius]